MKFVSSARLAVVVSHPIQYYSPWFRYLAANGFDGLRVFYLWDGGASTQVDPGFGVLVKWDIPLLDGYAREFVPNASKRPGTDRVSGLNNPDLINRLERFNPDAVLVFGYNYLSLYRLLFSRLPGRVPFLFRGDSHRLARGARGARGERREERGERGAECGVGSGKLPSSLFSLHSPLSPLPSPLSALPAALRRLWITAVLRRFSGFLYVGKANRDYFSYHGVDESKLFFCPHCVDNERFFSESDAAARAAAEWKKELGIAPDRRVVLFAGKFVPKKRPLDLVAAFNQANLPATTLVLVGNGELEPELRKQADGRCDIVFAPFQNQSRMPRTYRLGDVFVLPSFGKEETWGLAVNEAMCLGRPVIVSDHVGCAADLVQHGRNGLIFEAGSVPALAVALREAFAQPDRLREWGERSLEIIKGYSYEQATKGLVAALEVVGRNVAWKGNAAMV